MVDHLQSRVTPWRQYASHVKVRGTLSKMGVTCIVRKLFGGGGGGGANCLCLIFCKSVHFNDFNSSFNTIQTKRPTEISPNHIDPSTLLIFIVSHRLKISENSFVSPYDVMLVAYFNILLLHLLFRLCYHKLFVVVFSYLYTFLQQIVEEKGYRLKLNSKKII